jgi:predicted hydrolase (HD superfamily)
MAARNPLLEESVNREESWELLCEWTESDSLRKHMLAVEAAMRAYARKKRGGV